MITLIAFAVTLGILITFHELGHYWVARLCGVRVLRFSVGFGKVLARRIDQRGTEWAISAIPLGGYVKMLDQSPPGASAQQAREAFEVQPVGRRFAIVAAGPVFNLILAAALYAGLYVVGTEEPAPILAQPAAGTPAERAGVQAGDRVQAINGQSITSWNQARWALLTALANNDDPVRIDVVPAIGGTAQRDMYAPRLADPGEGDAISMAGLTLNAPAVVREVTSGSPGETAGLQPGDRIVGIADADRPTRSALIATIQRHPGQTLALRVLRDGVSLTLGVVPRTDTDEEGRQIGRIGVQLGADIEQVTVRYGVLESAWRGVTRTADTAWFSLRMMGRMLTGEASWRNISGPVTIADYAGQTAQIGLAAYVAFLALVSVSLGVLNLLPIPMLDGGHLLYYLLEMIRGKPVSGRWFEFGQRIGMALLVGLMSLALFNDFIRHFG